MQKYVNRQQSYSVLCVKEKLNVEENTDSRRGSIYRLGLRASTGLIALGVLLGSLTGCPWASFVSSQVGFLYL